MSLTTSEMTPADIAAVNGGFNNGGFNGDGWWIILFLILAMGGNWGNNFNGGSAPYVASDVDRGFNQMATMNGLSSLQDTVANGFANTATQLCGGFAGINQAVTNGFAQAEIADNSRQMANMQQMYGLSSQLSNCCCENRLASADLKYTIATENCADRQALSDGVKDIITNQTAGIQTILDKMCQQELDAYKRENDNLRSMVNMQNLAASQSAQTAQLIADNTAQTQYIVNRVAPYPIPSYTVPNPYGTGTGTTA